jgi:hypothetical protein
VLAAARNIDEARPASCELGMCSDGRWQMGMSRLDGVERVQQEAACRVVLVASAQSQVETRF